MTRVTGLTVTQGRSFFNLTQRRISDGRIGHATVSANRQLGTFGKPIDTSALWLLIGPTAAEINAPGNP
jgi:hypothetical protein